VPRLAVGKAIKGSPTAWGVLADGVLRGPQQIAQRHFPPRPPLWAQRAAVADLVNKGMLISELAPKKPLTPDQARIEALRNASKQARARLKAERERQRVQKAQKALQNAQSGPIL